MTDSLKKRFSYKLFTNFIGLLASILVAGIVPRSLGPIAYGNFSFLTNFFTRVFNFFDNGTSIAFYTKLSQKPNQHKLIKFYWGFIGLIGLVAALVFLPISYSNLCQIIWPDQKLLFIWMAFFWAFLTLTNSVLIKMVDAFALTAKGEILRLAQKILSVIIIFLMFWLALFTLFNYFIFQYIIILFLFICLLLLLKKNNISIYPKVKLNLLERNTYIKEFYAYSKPLVLLSLFGIIVGLFDRWILQNYAGSAQQGYYGLSLRIASICFLFTSAMTPLILREFSISFGKNDFEKIKTQYLNFSALFFFIAAFIAIFTSVQSNKIGIILGGNQYKDAHFAIMVMALYPIHQTLGQMNGSFFLATNNTKLYSNIGIVFQLLGIPFIVFLIAPSNLWGLNLGSAGLALKMVIIQVIAINVEIWYISKRLSFSFGSIFFKQIIILSFLGISAYGSFWSSDLLFDNMLVSFLFSGIIYTIIVTIFIFLFPSFISSSRLEIIKLIKSSTVKIFSVLKIIFYNKNGG